MATAQLATFNQPASNTPANLEGFCITSAMFGGVGGALAGLTAIGSSFEYASVLVGTLGVVVGSVVAGTAGRYVLAPIWTAFRARRFD